MVKKIAMYGTYRTRIPEKELRWKTRRDGIRQRYWYNTGKIDEVILDGRFEFVGTGRDLYRAVNLAITRYYVPRNQFMVVPADEFLENPMKFSRKGVWIMRDVFS